MKKKFPFLVIAILLSIITSCSDDNSNSNGDDGDNNVDSIEEILEIHEDAISELNELLTSLNINDAVNELKVRLESLPEISIVNTDDDGVHINYLSGVRSNILISKTNDNGVKTKGGISSTNNKDTSYSLKYRTNLLNEPLPITDRDVLIYEAFSDEFMQNEGLTIRNLFQSSDLDFNVTYLKDEQCTINSLQNLTDYGFVYFDTHGDGGELIVTREEIDIFSTTYLTMIFNDFFVEVVSMVDFIPSNPEESQIARSGDFYAINDSYISNLNGSFPDSIIYNSSCESTLTDELTNAFLSKGASTYLGYNDEVYPDFSKVVGEQFVSFILEDSNTTGDAYLNLPDITDNSDPFAEFEVAGNPNTFFSNELTNQLKILSNNQILDFNGLPISYFSQFDDFCSNYMQIFSFNYDDETEGANNIDIQISSVNNTSTIADGIYNLLDGECNYAEVDFFHSELFTNEEDGFIQNGTIEVLNNGNTFIIEGELIKISFDGTNETDTSLGSVIGRFVSE